MYGYPGLYRLKKADEFSSVFIFRRVCLGKYFKIHYKPNDRSYSRLGLIVSKRIHKRANKRNYMKRVIRELFRLEQINWCNYDIVVRVQYCFTYLDFNKIKGEFSNLTKIFKV